MNKEERLMAYATQYAIELKYSKKQIEVFEKHFGEFVKFGITNRW